jgi:hypothetical protein
MENHKRHIDHWANLNPSVKKISPKKRQVLYQELKSHGEVENPTKYTETHLEGGYENS